MAEGKKSVIIYSDLIHTVKKLPREKAGDLLMVILEYINDLNPVVEDPFVDLAFEPIKQQMKRDLKKWVAIKDKRSEAGKASAEAKKAAKESEQTLTNSTSVESVKQIQQEPTSSTVTGNVNDTVTVNGNDKKDDDEKGKKSPSSTIYSITVFEKVEIADNEFTLLACRRSGKTIAEVKLLFDEFIKDQRAVNKIAWNNEVDAKTHFHNWIAKKKGSSTGRTLVH